MQQSLRVTLAAVLIVTPLDVAAAQAPVGRSVLEVTGVREGRGYSGGLSITAAATSDGLVEIVVARDTTQLEYRSREPRIIRGFYPPAAVAAWIAAVDTLRAAWAAGTPLRELGRPVVPLAGGDPLTVQATASEETGQRHLTLSVRGCRSGDFVRNGAADERELPTLVASLAAAVADAERVPNARGPHGLDTRVYYEHAVGCEAKPLASNPPPVYPDVPRALRGRREVLTQFVVDSTGLVDPATIAFARGEDPRFANAARAALGQWRFTRPTRQGRFVRQRTHVALVFEPPLGDAVERGCAMAGASGVVVRRVSDVSDRPLETYLRHAAATLAIWLNAPGTTGAAIRFVVRRDGRLSDVVVDAQPSEAARRADFESRVRTIPFVLDPLPPMYAGDGLALEARFVARCHSPRTSMFWAQPTTFTPLPDGSIELANLHASWSSTFDTREEPPSRDVVSAEALRHFLDTTATLLPAADGTFPTVLDRWSGSLADVPVLGHRNGGLILGLGTQGQLHRNIACGQGGEWVNVRREDLAEFWRIGREALALRGSLVTGRVRTTNRTYFESEVACPVMPAVGNAPVRYPESIIGEARTSHEVLAWFVVDTLGIIEPGSIVTFPGTDARFTRAVLDVAPRWRFRPAFRGGRRVRQRAHMAIVVRPPEADASVLASKSVVSDSANRTIFFRPPR